MNVGSRTSFIADRGIDAAHSGQKGTQSVPADSAQHVSVIISTYDQPEWLERTLWAYARQSAAGRFEVIVADDGSGPETRERLDALRSQLPYPLTHIWQIDQGFRKCRALNLAIRSAHSDYLIFSDGDCLPRHDFIATHLQLRRPGRFLSGGYIKLPMTTSRALDNEQIALGNHANYEWLRKHGASADRKLQRLRMGPSRALFMDWCSPAAASWNGHNASGWKSDLIAVNGFDERMQYGGEDRELGERLHRFGIGGLRVRHRALVVHLDHERGYVAPEMIAKNRAIRRAAAKARTKWSEYGLRPGSGVEIASSE